MADDRIQSGAPGGPSFASPPQEELSPPMLSGGSPRPAPSTDPTLENLPGRGTPRPAMSRINRLEYGRPARQNALTGQATTLERFAAATRELAAPGGVPNVTMPAPGVFTRVRDAAKRMVGLPDDIAWMAGTLRDLRAESIGATGGRSSPAMQAAVRALAGDNGVSAFWDSEAMAVHARFGPEKAPVLAHIDEIARQHGPELGLAVSLACLNALAALPHGSVTLAPAVFATLRDEHLIDQLLHQDGLPAADRDPALTLARAVLQDIAGNDQFADLARVLCPQLPPGQLPALQRYLEAGQLATEQAAARGRAGPGEEIELGDLEAGQGPGAPTLAERVRDRAREALAGGAPPESHAAIAEDFFWDNHFRAEGPGTPLQQVKQHALAFMEQLGRPVDQGGPLNSMIRYGLAGADRHILADEATKLAAEVAAEPIERLVGNIQSHLATHVQTHLPWAADPDDATVRGLAALALSQSWSPDHRAGLSTADIVHGPRPEEGPDGVINTTIDLLARQYLAQRPLDLSTEGIERTPLYESVALDRLRHRMYEEAAHLPLGFDALLTLADRLGIPLDDATRKAADTVIATIEARSPRPAEPNAHEAGEVVGKFLDKVQFGNHIRVSDAVTLGASARGTSVNLANSQVDLPSVRDRKRPLNVRFDARGEGTLEQIFRAGAATHGGEMFMGRDQRWRVTGGGGLQVGHIMPGHRGDLGRAAGGVDIAAYGYERSDLQGAMWRVDRRIERDEETPTGPVFRQNDADVRETMGQMARMLHDRAPQCRDDVEREQLLEDFIARFADQGLSVTLMQQQSATHRSDASLSGALSVATGGDNGGRFGVSSGASYEKGWSTRVSERDTTGTYQINNVRSGWYDRLRANTSLDGSAYLRSVGIPAMQLASGSLMYDDASSSVRVRVPLRDGKIVPEKTFSDTETSDKALFKRAVLSNQQKWVDLFAYPHRHLPPEQAQQKGQEAVTAFFHKIDAIRESNHVYYARERLHPAVAEQLDRLSLVEQQLPPRMKEAHAEIQARRAALMSSDESWMPASLIAFQRNIEQDGPAGNLAVARGSRMAAVEGEREIIFDTPGWANLRQRERETTPGSLKE
ncbi:hypothetical protein OU995_18795 [Roseateles sp. SL47]|uniref:hypothetical protein n=1 Tax=Roseateles sp. SL47 TaxID=2995138 RepID=UPI00226F66F1|nr:hypothetical protein [Roseateles sp. SL47]WAC71619.1 hypothetical protein OU995_18795 [Roseateles sp. SL47]